jgi:hypothetical protein
VGKRRLRRREDRVQRDERVEFLGVDEVLEIVSVAKAQRDFLMPRWVAVIEELFKVQSGLDYMMRYVNLVSSLIYSADNILFDLEFEDEVEDEGLLRLGERLRERIERNFYELGFDYQFYLASYIGELFGTAGIYLAPRAKGRAKAILIYPWDIYFYYPQLGIDDPSQVIVRVVRMSRKEAERRFGVEVAGQAEVSGELGRAMLMSDLDERALKRVQEFVERSYGTDERLELKSVVEDYGERFFDYLRYLLFGQGSLSGQLVNIYEVWYKDGNLGQVCRAVVVGDKVVSHDAMVELSDYPFSVYNSEPILGMTGVGLGTGDKALVVQREIRELHDLLDEATNRFVRPTIIVMHFGGALRKDEIVNGIRNGDEVIDIDSPDTKIEEYVPKVNLEALYALIQRKEENLRYTLGLMSDLIFGQNVSGVRSASHAQLISMFASSHLKTKALRFEKFIEELMTLYGQYIVMYDERFAGLYGVPFRVEVYAHTSSPIMAMNYQEILAGLVDSGLVPKEILVEMMPIPMKAKVKKELKRKEKLAEMMQVLMLKKGAGGEG